MATRFFDSPRELCLLDPWTLLTINSDTMPVPEDATLFDSHALNPIAQERLSHESGTAADDDYSNEQVVTWTVLF